MDKYLNELKERKQSKLFDHFLDMLILAGDCPVKLTNNIIGGKWKPVIFNLIVHDVNRFGEMLHLVDGLSKKVLTTQLRELENDGVVERIVFEGLPKRVEYNLTIKGKTFIPVITAMCEWAIENRKSVSGFQDNT
jgi:DNA-binding HxlR family transcriptional regulator